MVVSTSRGCVLLLIATVPGRHRAASIDAQISALQAQIASIQGSTTGDARGSAGGAQPFPDLRHEPRRSIPLHNLWGEQYFGRIAVGTPPVEQTMVFDTGSEALVVKGSRCALAGRRQRVLGGTGRCQGPRDGGYSASRSIISKYTVMAAF